MCQEIDRGLFGAFKRSLNTTLHGYSYIADETGCAPTERIERFEVRPGDCGSVPGWSDCDEDRERSELMQTSDLNTVGTTFWYGWYFFLPDDYVNVYPTKVVLGQFHQAGSHPVWMFLNNSDGYLLDDQLFGETREYHLLIDNTDLRGKWHRIEVQVDWSHNKDGFFRVWANGEQKIDYIGQTLTAESTYFKYGLYRSYMSRYMKEYGTTEVPGQVVYYSNVRRAYHREGLMAPSQTAKS